MLTNVFEPSAVFICCTVSAVLSGARSQPTQLTIRSSCSATTSFSSPVTFSIHSGLSTFSPSGGVRIATT